MMRALTICLLALPLLPQTALAGGLEAPVDDAPVEVAATPAPAFSWTGFYAGVSAISGDFSDGGSDLNTSGFGVQFGYLRDLGTLVVGGELAYSKGDYGNGAPASDWNATRLKLIGGYDAGRFLPYVFVGMTSYDVNQASPFSDTMANYGLGARYALGRTGKVVLGLEYLVESKSNFDNNFDLDNRELALRLDYRF